MTAPEAPAAPQAPAAPRSVLVVGSGIAGLYAALRLRAVLPQARVTLTTKSRMPDSSTWCAQGGIAAVFGGSPAGHAPDSVQAHVADTLAAGAGLCDAEAVRLLCTGAARHILRLQRLGAKFDTTPDGLPARGREAAHSAARILHVDGDATGAGVAAALIRAVAADPGITVLEDTFLAELVTRQTGGGHTAVVGASVLRDGGLTTIAADAVVLATGGAGQLFDRNTNPTVATADGLAAAWRAGAVVRDLEFFQFHPTALDVPGHPLISEAVRGEGAVLLDGSGRRFLSAYHPAAELAPRDVVSRGIARHLAARGEHRVWLDATGMARSSLAARFPSLSRTTAAHGFDWENEPLPVVPAAHYWMGGVQTDLWARTSVQGLYAAGEAACTGVHGANRLASNSLLEGLVFADRAAAAMGGAPGPWPVFDSADVELSEDEGTEPCDRAVLQRMMQEHAGVVRESSGLEVAAKQLAQWRNDDGSVTARETANLLLASRLLVHAARAREVSCGAHYRADSPQSPDAPIEHPAPSLAWRKAADV